VDVGSKGKVAMSPRKVADSEDSQACKDVSPQEATLPVASKPVVSAFGARASLPEPDQ